MTLQVSPVFLHFHGRFRQILAHAARLATSETPQRYRMPLVLSVTGPLGTGRRGSLSAMDYVDPWTSPSNHAIFSCAVARTLLMSYSFTGILHS